MSELLRSLTSVPGGTRCEILALTSHSQQSVNRRETMAGGGAGLQGGLNINKIIQLFETDQVKHQEKAVIAIVGETFEQILGPAWWSTATR